MAYGAIGEEQEEYQGQLHQNWLFFIRFQWYRCIGFGSSL